MKITSITAVALLGTSLLASPTLAQNASGDLDASGSVNGTVGATVGGVTGSGNVSGGAAAGANASTDGDNTSATGNVDASATASLGLTAEDTAALDDLGDIADDFFTDDTRAEVRPEAEVRSAFNALTPQQQEQLKTTCDDVIANRDQHSETVIGLCNAVDTM